MRISNILITALNGSLIANRRVIKVILPITLTRHRATYKRGQRKAAASLETWPSSRPVCPDEESHCLIFFRFIL
jgi:hypothetical protein